MFGTITSINGLSLIVAESRSGSSVSVATSGSTRVTVTTPVALNEIAKGDSVVVTGTGSGTAITASHISDMGTRTAGFVGRAGEFASGAGPNAIGRARRGLGSRGSANPTGAFAVGTVTSVNGSTFVISPRGESGTPAVVTTTSSTTVTKRVPAALADLKVGQPVQIIGTTASNGVIAATAIREGGSGFGSRGGFGAVPASPNSNTFGA